MLVGQVQMLQQVGVRVRVWACWNTWLLNGEWVQVGGWWGQVGVVLTLMLALLVVTAYVYNSSMQQHLYYLQAMHQAQALCQGQ
jgi:hypothetical protein